MASSSNGLLDELIPKNEVVLEPAIQRVNTPMTNSTSWPSSMCGLLQKQRSKFRTDWETVSRIDPQTSYKRYLYCWLIVNTRSFYYKMPNIRTRSSREDCMVLCPFIDLFNHDDSGVLDQLALPLPATKLTVRFPMVHITPSVLIRETDGFILDNNRWDSVPVDHVLMKYLQDSKVEEQLQRTGYLGDYRLSPDGLCYRTEVAVRSQTLTPSDWERFVQGFEIGDEVDDKIRAKAFVKRHVLEPFCQEAEVHIKELEGSNEFPLGPRQILLERWRQIQRLLQQAAASLCSRDGGSSESI
ncbi:MAG: hypothetical protein Q9216_000578 [Gyalolechia sp. 2 TL-2023]